MTEKQLFSLQHELTLQKNSPTVCQTVDTRCWVTYDPRGLATPTWLEAGWNVCKELWDPVYRLVIIDTSQGTTLVLPKLAQGPSQLGAAQLRWLCMVKCSSESKNTLIE